MKNIHKFNVYAVVVTYQPELELIKKLLHSLSSQVKTLVIIDNGSDANLEIFVKKMKLPNLDLLLTGENSGIAAAHNLGIKHAKNHHADFVLLMDQDSVPSQDMVEKLLCAILEVKNKSILQPIAAGPNCVDSRTNKKYFFVTQQHIIPTRWYSNASTCIKNFSIEVSALISSGTLIDLKALETVGGMRSNYFIDHVDTEWCFRAKEKGYILLGVPSALMQHTLGDKIANIWFFGWKRVAYHSPLRDYYMFRNTLLMFYDVKMPIFMGLFLLWRLLKFIFYFLLFAPQRLTRFKSMALGIFHGLCNVRGKIDLKTSKCTLIPVSDLDP